MPLSWARIFIHVAVGIWRELMTPAGFDIRPQLEQFGLMLQLHATYRHEGVQLCVDWLLTVGIDAPITVTDLTAVSLSQLPPYQHPDFLRSLLHFFVVQCAPFDSHTARSICSRMQQTTQSRTTMCRISHSIVRHSHRP
jgi:hypothetical protein